MRVFNRVVSGLSAALLGFVALLATAGASWREVLMVLLGLGQFVIAAMLFGVMAAGVAWAAGLMEHNNGPDDAI